MDLMEGLFLSLWGIPVLWGMGAAYERFSREGRRIHALKATPRTSIADVADGALVKVVGRVVLLEKLVSPYTRTPCCCYRTLMWRWVSDGNHGAHAVRDEEDRWRDFLIDDGTGRALVSLPSSPTWAFPREVLQVEEGDVEQWRPYEWTLTAGEVIAAVGVARRRPDRRVTAETGYREAALPVVLELPLLTRG